TWRDDPEFLEGLLDRYRTMSDELSPENREHDRASERHRAEAELLAGLPRHQRPKARLLLRLARRYIPLREVGKVAFLQTIDVARVAARALGRAHAEDGLLANADDVFYLT